MIKTYACVKKLKKIVNIKKITNIKTGISNFIDWYKEYHKI